MVVIALLSCTRHPLDTAALTPPRRPGTQEGPHAGVPCKPAALCWMWYLSSAHRSAAVRKTDEDRHENGITLKE